MKVQMPNEDNLKDALRKLQESASKIANTRGYNTELEKIKMLEEMIKEQLRHENISASTRATR